MSQYNAQAKSRWIEQFISYNLGIELISASVGRGDGVKDGEYYEFKTSTTNKGRNLNLRQIRLYQDIQYYICTYIDELHLSQSKTFKLTHDELEEELALINGVDKNGDLRGFTHGTATSNRNNPVPEYSLTIPIKKSSTTLERWEEKFWYDELYDALTGE